MQDLVEGIDREIDTARDLLAAGYQHWEGTGGSGGRNRQPRRLLYVCLFGFQTFRGALNQAQEQTVKTWF